MKTEIPTIRLTHSLQSMLLMTTPLHSVETHGPFPHFRLLLAEPLSAPRGDDVMLYDDVHVYMHGFDETFFDALPVTPRTISFFLDIFKRSKRTTPAPPYRLILNLCNYIHSLSGLRDEHLTQVQQSKHGRLKPGTTKRRDYLLGREIKLSPELRALASADGPARYRFKSRWLVRGHFRHQPIGEGRNERKVIWIQPHWKGPKEGPVLVPRYVAGEEA